MADPHLVTTLRRKLGEIEGVISAYRAKIEEAERDLSSVATTLRLFELGDQREQFPAHLALGRFFGRGELLGACTAALIAYRRGRRRSVCRRHRSSRAAVNRVRGATLPDRSSQQPRIPAG